MPTRFKALTSQPRRFIMAIMLFVVLDLSTLVINRWLAEEMSRDAVAINLAGRQRMLSQQTTKALLQAGDATSTVEFEAAIGEFKAAFQLFEQTLTAFAEGGEAPGGDGAVETGSPSEVQAVQPPSSTATFSWPMTRSMNHSRAAIAPSLSS